MFSGKGGRSKDLPTIARQMGKYDKYTWERQIQVRHHNLFGGNGLWIYVLGEKTEALNPKSLSSAHAPPAGEATLNSQTLNPQTLNPQTLNPHALCRRTSCRGSNPQFANPKSPNPKSPCLVQTHLLQGKQRFGHYLIMWAQKHGDDVDVLSIATQALREALDEWPDDQASLEKTAMLHRTLAIGAFFLRTFRRCCLLMHRTLSICAFFAHFRTLLCTIWPGRVSGRS
jgi:hypothetical protein